MARTIKLPARSNALSYDATEVADILLGLHSAAEGEGVMVDDAVDTEPKARVRCRVVAKLVEKGVTIEYGALDSDNAELAVELGFVALPEPDDADDADDDAEVDIPEDAEVNIPGLKTRTHVVQQGEEYAPVLSVKKES